MPTEKNSVKQTIKSAGKEVEKLRNQAVFLTPSYHSKLNKKIEHTFVKPEKGHLTFGQKAADHLTTWAGSWFFIILLFTFIAIWVYSNLNFANAQWDPWPFIILNLVLSCLAAIQAPIILMSQNRQTFKDRLRTEYDYKVNRKAEKEIQELKKQLDRIERKIK